MVYQILAGNDRVHQYHVMFEMVKPFAVKQILPAHCFCVVGIGEHRIHPLFKKVLLPQ
jgi:hypothetical protein